MRQNQQNPMISNFCVKTYVVSPAREPPQVNMSRLLIIVEFGLSSRKLPLSCQKEILIFVPDWVGRKCHASFYYASYIIIVFTPQISVKFRNKILTLGVY